MERKFGGGKFWRIDSFRAFGEIIDHPIELQVLIWMVLIWQIMDSPNLPTFPPTKVSLHTVYQLFFDILILSQLYCTFTGT